MLVNQGFFCDGRTKAMGISEKPVDFVMDIDRRGKKEFNYGLLTSGIDDIFAPDEVDSLPLRFVTMKRLYKEELQLDRLNIVAGLETEVCLRAHCNGLDCLRQPKEVSLCPS